jgi:site-specific recombinase XerD
MHSTSFRIPVDIPPALHPLIEQFCSDAFRVRGVTQQTVRADLCYLCRFFRHVGCPDSSLKLFQSVSSESIGNFLRTYAGTFSSSSLERMQILLRSFLRFAYRFSLIDRDLSALVPTRKHRQMGTVPRSLPDECIARLRCGIDRCTSAGLRDSAIICLLATYGVRGVQIRRLRLDGIDWRNERIHFPAAKGGRAVEQPLMPEAGNLLSEYIRRGRPATGIPEVFLTLREPFCPLLNARYLSEILRRRIKHLQLVLPDGVSHGTHGFRHAFASRMVGKIPFKELVDQLGHRDPASTLIYAKVDFESLRQAALPWPGGGQ